MNKVIKDTEKDIRVKLQLNKLGFGEYHGVNISDKLYS